MQGGTPVLERLVGREQDAAPLHAAGVDDMAEGIGGVGPAAETAHFVTDWDTRLDMGLEGVPEAALVAGAGEIVDQRGGGEEGVRAVLDGAAGNGCGERRLATAGVATASALRPPAIRTDTHRNEGAGRLAEFRESLAPACSTESPGGDCHSTPKL